ncbi:hypothetical protein HPB47_019052 [Ixodes persulcatus]|uniref:Uncharacterized protein n=1 Tax=Ixodes persulcatus TaxID=34615 RepID=A0AC60R1C4_IXOPE|nr:hypothetical protein HPB47_019052 [Ixodes persulcatus]
MTHFLATAAAAAALSPAVAEHRPLGRLAGSLTPAPHSWLVRSVRGKGGGLRNWKGSSRAPEGGGLPPSVARPGSSHPSRSIRGREDDLPSNAPSRQPKYAAHYVFVQWEALRPVRDRCGVGGARDGVVTGQHCWAPSYAIPCCAQTVAAISPPRSSLVHVGSNFPSKGQRTRRGGTVSGNGFSVGARVAMVAACRGRSRRAAGGRRSARGTSRGPMPRADSVNALDRVHGAA